MRWEQHSVTMVIFSLFSPTFLWLTGLATTESLTRHIWLRRCFPNYSTIFHSEKALASPEMVQLVDCMYVFMLFFFEQTACETRPGKSRWHWLDKLSAFRRRETSCFTKTTKPTQSQDSNRRRITDDHSGITSSPIWRPHTEGKILAGENCMSHRQQSVHSTTPHIMLYPEWHDLMASIHLYFARKQVGDTPKFGKPEMRSSCRKFTRFPLIGCGSASVPHLGYLSVSRHFIE